VRAAIALLLQSLNNLLKGSILRHLQPSIALSFCQHPSSQTSTHKLTLLGLAVLSRKVCVSTVRRVSAAVELLVARTLQRSTLIDESVTLDAERALRITRVGDRCRSDASKTTSEALRVGLAEVEDACATESGDAEEKDGAGELHLEN
jgi:thioesterase domain-containing protein